MAASMVVEARALAKSYGALQALDAVSFEVREGEIFGFIGADGAGKSTAFRIIGGVLTQNSGEVRVLETTPRKARPRVGYLTQPFSLYQDLSIAENLKYAAGLREVSPEDFATRSDRYCKMFDLNRFMDRLAGRLSGGMKQKLALSCALIADPKLLLLDEPTTGVDPVTRRDFWDALTSLATGGMSIIVATPYLDEAERCHRVALMERGKIYDIDSPADFRSKLGLTRLEVHADPLKGAEEAFAGSPAVSDVQRFGDRLDVMAPDPDAAERDLRERAQAKGIRVTEIRRSLPTLENAFVNRLREMRGASSTPRFPDPSPPIEDRQIVIGAKDLNRRFGSFQAVKDFQLEIRNGEIYGLLGSNGAGKTTSIKMMCGLIEPTSGSVTLLGRSKGLRSAEVRSRIGYMSQKFSLYDDLTIGENLDFYARLYGVNERVREERKQWVLETAELKGEAGMLDRIAARRVEAARGIRSRRDARTGGDISGRTHLRRRPAGATLDVANDQRTRRPRGGHPGGNALPRGSRAVQPARIHGGGRNYLRGLPRRSKGTNAWDAPSVSRLTSRNEHSASLRQSSAHRAYRCSATCCIWSRRTMLSGRKRRASWSAPASARSNGHRRSSRSKTSSSL